MSTATEAQTELILSLANGGEDHGRADLTPRERTALRALLDERAELLRDRERLKRIEKLVCGAFGKESIDAALEVDAIDAATTPKSEEKR